MGLRTASSKGSRALLIFFMFMVALLGLVIGPASAVLMLPRQTVCRSHIAMNILTEQSLTGSNCVHSSNLAQREFR